MAKFTRAYFINKVCLTDPRSAMVLRYYADTIFSFHFSIKRQPI